MGDLFKGPAKPPPAPDPLPMPDLNDPAILLAKRRPALRASAASGRASTELSAGQGNYSDTKLGVS